MQQFTPCALRCLTRAVHQAVEYSNLQSIISDGPAAKPYLDKIALQ